MHPRERDFLGYGRQLPALRWPDGRSLAVSFVVNFEEGAEFSVSDGDPRNEAVYEVIDRQDGIDPCIDSHFEYGTRVGWWRLADLFAAHGAPFTLSSCGRAVQRLPWLARDAVDRGHEVSGHGWRWQTAAGLDAAAEARVIDDTVAAITAATGQRPLGWHTRSVSTPHTRRLLVERGFLYDSDAYNDDTPYLVPVDGRQHLVLPYAFDTNDMQFQHTQRFSTGREFAEYVCAAADWLAREGATRPRMLSVGLHLRMVTRPARIGAVEQVLQHLRGRGDCWIATRAQIAQHWLAHSG
ncbi:polysaccharide deacetylase family protein [Rubrivivax sp. RP6-9]|uniref:polysaccharide deacetylase family protein n=1 Tax=Rubrivivax sp. RP6-9 TaxID=3415750 RepID=UPI003CC5731F